MDTGPSLHGDDGASSPRDGYRAVNAGGERRELVHLPTESVAVDWQTAVAPVAYEDAVAQMIARAAAVADGVAPELVWLVQHPALYTGGTSSGAAPSSAPFPVYRSGRGGQWTYHGPGQRIAYVMLDLRRRGADIRRFVASLEEWIIRTLGRFGVAGERRGDRIGVWVARPDKGAGCEDKIAAIGIRVQRWVTLHGIAINVAPDLSHFAGIVPCGIADARYGVTSLADLGRAVGMDALDAALRAEFEGLFGPTLPAA